MTKQPRIIVIRDLVVGQQVDLFLNSRNYEITQLLDLTVFRLQTYEFNKYTNLPEEEFNKIIINKVGTKNSIIVVIEQADRIMCTTIKNTMKALEILTDILSDINPAEGVYIKYSNADGKIIGDGRRKYKIDSINVVNGQKMKINLQANKSIIEHAQHNKIEISLMKNKKEILTLKDNNLLISRMAVYSDKESTITISQDL